KEENNKYSLMLPSVKPKNVQVLLESLYIEGQRAAAYALPFHHFEKVVAPFLNPYRVLPVRSNPLRADYLIEQINVAVRPYIVGKPDWRSLFRHFVKDEMWPDGMLFPFERYRQAGDALARLVALEAVCDVIGRQHDSSYYAA